MKYFSHSLLRLFILAVLFSSCNTKNDPDKPWHELPAVTNLKDLKQTGFALTLESPVPADKNIIYAPAFLYAWDQIKEKLEKPVALSDANSEALRLLERSRMHLNALQQDEYSAHAEIVGGAIIAEAFFNKTLPFETKLEALEKPLLFNGTPVAAFGMYYFDENFVKFCSIPYYSDDERFILKLSPQDKQHELLLVKGLEKYSNLAEALAQVNTLIEKGKAEAKDSSQAWKYEIAGDDQFAIPSIGFNIATHYKDLEGQAFLTQDQKQHTFEVAYQRTGFILNENGAVAESEAYAVTDSAAMEPAATHPKNMAFDTSFLVIIKRTGQANPYFVMQVNNTELLKKK